MDGSLAAIAVLLLRVMGRLYCSSAFQLGSELILVPVGHHTATGNVKKGRVVNINLPNNSKEVKLTEIKERVQGRLEKIEQISTPQEAQAQVAILPLLAVHEARYAVQQLKEKFGGDDDMFEMLEPIIRSVGWVEASAYFLDVTTQREAVRSLTSTGLFQPQYAQADRG